MHYHHFSKCGPQVTGSKSPGCGSQAPTPLIWCSSSALQQEPREILTHSTECASLKPGVSQHPCQKNPRVFKQHIQFVPCRE